MLKLTKRGDRPEDGREVFGLTVTFEERRQHKFRTRLDNGRETAVALPRGACLRPGDILASEDGLLVEVRAAAERLSLVQCRDADQVARLCYQLGRLCHPVQIDGLRISYPEAPAVDIMVRGLGCDILAVTAAFDPEGPAGGGLY
ncbi:MAG: urease accessory protein UreE [Desulfovibrionaceae bacterium]|nr:urease accessory protein UreE [Desulfovibrionaceae bacterium]MBF0512913.1 urease accessory protein UreE [Desulfovibrionaceae bacterium]